MPVSYAVDWVARIAGEPDGLIVHQAGKPLLVIYKGEIGIATLNNWLAGGHTYTVGDQVPDQSGLEILYSASSQYPLFIYWAYFKADTVDAMTVDGGNVESVWTDPVPYSNGMWTYAFLTDAGDVIEVDVASNSGAASFQDLVLPEMTAAAGDLALVTGVCNANTRTFTYSGVFSDGEVYDESNSASNARLFMAEQLNMSAGNWQVTVTKNFNDNNGVLAIAINVPFSSATTPVQKTAAMSWNVHAAVEKEFDMSWNVADGTGGLTAVSITRAMSWNVADGTSGLVIAAPKTWAIVPSWDGRRYMWPGRVPNPPSSSYFKDDPPNVWFAGCIASWIDRYTTDPTRQYFRIADFVEIQGIHTKTHSLRQTAKPVIEGVRAHNPNMTTVWHYNFKATSVKTATNDSTSFITDHLRQHPELWDECFLRDGTGEIMSQERDTFQSIASNYRNQVCRELYVDLWLDLLEDKGSDGSANLLAIGRSTFMHDGLPETLDDRFGSAEHAGLVAGVPSTTELTVPTWASVELDTAIPVDAEGYSTLVDTFGVLIRNETSGKLATAIANKYKTVSASTGRIKMTTDLNYPAAVNDKFTLHNRVGNGNTYNADWDQDGVAEGRTGSAGDSRRVGIIGFFDYMLQQASLRGYDMLRICNGAGSIAAKLAGRGAIPPTLYTNYWDAMQAEWAFEHGLGFQANEDASGYNKGNWNLQKQLLMIYYAKTFLQKDNNPRIGWPFLFLNTIIRAVGSFDPSRYALLTELDASYARFCLGVTAVIDHTIVNLEVESHSWPWFIQEQCVKWGRALSQREVSLNYDPASTTVPLRAPDYGTHIYAAEFENLYWFTNFREPPGANGAPWVPHHLPGGQATTSADQVVLPSGPLFMLSSAYVHPDDSRKTAAGANPYHFGRDDILNDGSEVTNQTITVGPGEAVMVLKGS